MPFSPTPIRCAMASAPREAAAVAASQFPPVDWDMVVAAAFQEPLTPSTPPRILPALSALPSSSPSGHLARLSLRDTAMACFSYGKQFFFFTKVTHPAICMLTGPVPLSAILLLLLNFSGMGVQHMLYILCGKFRSRVAFVFPACLPTIVVFCLLGCK